MFLFSAGNTCFRHSCQGQYTAVFPESLDRHRSIIFQEWPDHESFIVPESVGEERIEISIADKEILDSSNHIKLENFESRENSPSPYRQSDIPIKKRYLSERKEDSGKKIRKVLDIEDIVPEPEQKSHKTGCEGCCLESTNVCLQKINTNLNPNEVVQEEQGCSSQSRSLDGESQGQVSFVEDQGYFSSPTHLVNSESENLGMENPADFEETVKLEGLRLGKIVDAEILEEFDKFEDVESFESPKSLDSQKAASPTPMSGVNSEQSTIPVILPSVISFPVDGNDFPITLSIQPSTFETSEISDNLKTLNLSDPVRENFSIGNTDGPLNLTITDHSSIPEPIPELSDSEDEKPSLKTRNVPKKESIFTIHCDEPNCKYSFKNEENKKIHKILYHSNLINESNQCIYCDKTFARKRLLKRHLFLHLKIYQYFCKYCQKGFKLKHQLKNHESLHERSEELIISKTRRSKKADKLEQDVKLLGLLCQHCGSTFGTKGALTAHLKRCDNVMVT